MINYYSKIGDIELSFSNIQRDKNEFENIMARFERPIDGGFDYSEWKLPSITNIKAFGFSESEVMEQERYLRNNLTLIWEIARENSNVS